MKRFLVFTVLAALMLWASISIAKDRGEADSQGRNATGTAAQQAATNGAYSSISTNLNSERAANQALTKAATNSQSVGGPVNAPGGVSFGGGTGTGEHGFMYWFYIGLGIFFLIWLVLAIVHRAHVRREWRAGAGNEDS